MRLMRITVPIAVQVGMIINMYSVLFVCMGNICRSPTAEAVFKKHLSESIHADKVRVDSAGTIGYHVGERPDHRAIQAAEAAGYSMQGILARQLRVDDIHDFDLVLVMDEDNLRNTRSLFLNAGVPADYIDKKVKLFLSFASAHQESEVPDPYYGGADGFRFVIELIEDASRSLLQDLQQKFEK